jgi:peroxiredoxin Q/BCP
MALIPALSHRERENEGVGVEKEPAAMTDLLQSGSRAPDFTLAATGEQTFTLSALAGQKHIVLVFYVGDNTPDCNRQLASLRDDASELAGLDVVVVGVNPASTADHERYSTQLGLSYPLLSDVGGQVASQYGALNADRSVQRSVYVVDKAGIIRFAARGMHWTPEFYEALASLE